MPQLQEAMPPRMVQAIDGVGSLDAISDRLEDLSDLDVEAMVLKLSTELESAGVPAGIRTKIVDTIRAGRARTAVEGAGRLHQCLPACPNRPNSMEPLPFPPLFGSPRTCMLKWLRPKRSPEVDTRPSLSPPQPISKAKRVRPAAIPATMRTESRGSITRVRQHRRTQSTAMATSARTTMLARLNTGSIN